MTFFCHLIPPPCRAQNAPLPLQRKTKKQQ
nr:MAG TPA: hypothetical protein [Caudoviricetes sp.]